MPKYPVRARIVDVELTTDDMAHQFYAAFNSVPKTPAASRPHIGKEGIAEKLADGTVLIVLDDGSHLFGHECWWEPIE